MTSLIPFRINFNSIKINFIISAVFFFCLTTNSNVQAQTDSIAPVKRSQINNIIKLNAVGLLFGSISLQDEVYFNSKFSGALGVNIGVSSLFLPKYLIDNSTISLNDMKLTGLSITPELRYYTSSVAPKGFYIAPYYRNSNYNLDDVIVHYTSVGEKKTVSLKGDYKQNAGGIMVGSQSRSGEHLVLDWWILGFALGSGKYDLNGTGSFSQDDIDDLHDELKKLDDSFDTEGSTSTNLHITYSTSFSIRMGFAIGYIF